METQHPTYVLVCESVHDVMALEKALRSAGIPNDMIPTPRELTSDCGMALEVNGTSLARLQETANRSSIHVTGIYTIQPDGFSPA